MHERVVFRDLPAIAILCSINCGSFDRQRVYFAHLRSKLMAFNVKSARLDRLKRESVLWRGSPESLCTYDFCFIKRKIWFSSAAVAIPNYGLKLLQAKGMNVDGMSPHCLIIWSLLCKQFFFVTDEVMFFIVSVCCRCRCRDVFIQL